MAKPKISADITANDKTAGAFNSAKRSVDGLQASYRALAGAAVIGGVVKLTASFAAQVDETNKLAGQLGISTEALSELEFAAAQSGIEFRTMALATQRLVRRLSEAADGGGPAADALKELGVNARELEGARPEQVIEILADALQGVGTQYDRVRLAQKLFDSEGVKFLRLLQGGSEGIRELRQQAADLGVTLTQDTANAFTHAQDQIGIFQAGLRAAGRDIAEIFLPVVGEAAQWLGETLPKASQFAKNAIDGLRTVAVGAAAGLASLFGDTDTADKLFGLFEVYRDNLAGVNQELAKTKEQADQTWEALRGGAGGGESEESAKDAERRQEAQERFLQGLRREVALQNDASEVAKTRFEIEQGSAATFDEATKRRALALAAQIDAENAAQAQQKANLKKYLAGIEERGKLEMEALQARIKAEQEAADESVKIATEAAKRQEKAWNDAADAYKDQLEQIRREVEGFAKNITDIVFDMTGSVKNALTDLAESFAKLLFKRAVADPLVDAAVGIIDGFFARGKGGPMFDRPTLVGERGPELIDGAGNVKPAGTFGGGVNINFQINSLDPRTAAQVIVENKSIVVGVVREAIQRAGGDVRFAT